LLEEAGADLQAPWLLAEGADAAAMSRSVPMAQALDDALLALYQNGERRRPENGYPVRLFLPGYEGNMNVTWLRRLKVTSTPSMTKDETSRYTDLQADGTSRMLTYPMEVKSVMTRPSPAVALQGPGLYEVSGIAWSGQGTITQVEVSADGGQTWAAAALSDPVLPRALTRFRSAWMWNGAPAVLKTAPPIAAVLSSRRVRPWSARMAPTPSFPPMPSRRGRSRPPAR
jgi:sulfane dehydrogenase subunit SoxC